MLHRGDGDVGYVAREGFVEVASEDELTRKILSVVWPCSCWSEERRVALAGQVLDVRCNFGLFG